jgi:Na+/H+ antiporter NhaC
MQNQNQIRNGYILILITFLISILLVNTPVAVTSWSLLPPLLAIIISFITSRLSMSLGSAVFLGSFLSIYGTDQRVFPSLLRSITKTMEYFLSAFVGEKFFPKLMETNLSIAIDHISLGNLQILGFVFLILSMVQIMTLSGGLHSLVESLQKWIVGPRSAQFVTALLGCFIFIDDYANTMIVGTTMKKITDRYNISREKLAFIVDATSAPVAGVALVSTWIGYEVGLFSDMAKKFSWQVDGYSIFLDAIEFRFYCFLMIFFVFVNILFGIDYGPMKNAKNENQISKNDDENLMQGHWLCAVFPVLLLLTLVFTLLWRDGGGANSEFSVFSMTSWRLVLTQSKNGISILLVSSLFSYISAIILSLSLSNMGSKELIQSLFAGLKSSILPIIILILAWSLKLVCDDLKTGEFIVSILGNRVEAMWLPAAIFLVSAITAFATGTSWGTMAILIPTVTPLAVAISGGEYSLYVALCLAAILDGSIMGDHCSPISDTTIMSSISTECDLMKHVRTQLPYSLLVGLIALFVCYIPVGFSLPSRYSYFLSLFLIVGIFFILKKISERKKSL